MAQTELESVIGLCKMVQSGQIEPFDVDFDYIMGVIRKYYPKIQSIEDFCLDATALKEVSNVLEKQSDWIAHQSTTLWKDPFMLNQQLMKMDISAIADSFLKSWHPILENEQISAQTLANSLGYWGGLIPFDERWQDPEVTIRDTEYASVQEAYDLGLLLKEGFSETIEKFWLELGEKAGQGGSIDYWDWIIADTYAETVLRAYLTMFLVSYGYANITHNRLIEETMIVHHVEPREDPGTDKISIPVMIDYEEWKLWRKE